LGVFVGGCTLEAAEAVCNACGDVPVDVLDGLALLKDNSLLRREQGVGSEPRFVILEAIREYALERIEASGEAERVRQQHAAYYLKLAKLAEASRVGNEKIAIAHLEEKQANLVAALSWSQTSDDTGLGGRLIDSLQWFWQLHGEWWQLREWLPTILFQPPTVESPADCVPRLHLLSELVDDNAQKQTLVEESLLLYQSIGDTAGSAVLLMSLSLLAYHIGDIPRATQLHDECLALVRKLGDQQYLSSMLHSLGDLACGDGNYSRAVALFTECLTIRRAWGATDMIADTLNAMGDLLFNQGDITGAQALYLESLGLFQEIKHRLMLAWVLRNLGRVAHAQGDDIQARALLVKSLVLFQQHGWLYAIGCCLDAHADVAGTQGQPEQAARLFGAGQNLRQTSRNNLGWTWPISARVDYERVIAATRAQLDDATFMTAWAAGATLTQEQAIVYALGDDTGVTGG
jgi:tetratricopeptide (TPR) repeat protein